MGETGGKREYKNYSLNQKQRTFVTKETCNSKIDQIERGCEIHMQIRTHKIEKSTFHSAEEILNSQFQKRIHVPNKWKNIKFQHSDNHDDLPKRWKKQQISNFEKKKRKNTKSGKSEKCQKHQKLEKAKKRLSGNGPKMGLRFGCACTPNVNQDLIIKSRFKYT